MERIYIAVAGPVNSGKSTLVNALCGQEVSLVSPVAGTTTDPVRKAAELPGIGPCIIIDTPGLEDSSPLGPERMRRTMAALDEADIIVEMSPNSTGPLQTPRVAYTPGESLDSLLKRIKAALPEQEESYLTGNLVKPGDKVVLVMPQDSEAPKGRIILPQVQVLRELLDRGCIPVCCTLENLQKAVETAPSLVITDSQVFREVNSAIPSTLPLTSFSVLLAGAKGDLKTYVEGAAAIGRLKDGDRVLIAEACTHVPDTEDIGRVIIPALLRKRAKVEVDVAAGNDFPEDLSIYSLIIHCGACVASRQLVRSRIKKALREGVPITNYGIAIAALQGILQRIEIP